MTGAHPLAVRVVDLLGARGMTLGVAESLTGGLLTSAIVDVPGASAVLRGGIVAYDTRVKASLLGVDGALLRSVGAVDARVAAQMAAGVRRATALDTPTSTGVATTGVAGPDPQDGHVPGTVYVAVDTDAGAAGRALRLGGDRRAVREAAVDAALRLLLEALHG